MVSRSNHAAIPLLITLLIISMIAARLPAAVQAQDITGLDTQQISGNAGPYAIEAEVRPLPSLQALQHTVKVTHADTGEPAEDVRVTVYASRQGSSDETGYAIATPFSDGPGVYFAVVKFKKPGVWETALALESHDGNEYGLGDNFTFEVPPPSQNLEAGLVFLGVALMLVGGSAYIAWQVRRNMRRRQTAGAP